MGVLILGVSFQTHGIFIARLRQYAEEDRSMPARPAWSGQIRISLVAFKVVLSSALERGSQIPLHEFDRKSGERIHQQNITEDGTPVEREDIVKGFEAKDDAYVLLEPDKIENIRLPSSDTLNLESFIDVSTMDLARFERPYFVLPDGKDANEIYAVMHEALQESGKAGLGQIAMGRREELCALYAVEEGLMLSTLRYDAELEEPEDALPGAPSKKPKADSVELMRQLIGKHASAAHFEKFHDHYHEALRELVNAKKAHRKPRLPKAGKPDAKEVNFMDALRKSLHGRPGKGNASHATHRRRRPA
jgi:DNA end-binding protein Ku